MLIIGRLGRNLSDFVKKNASSCRRGGICREITGKIALGDRYSKVRASINRLSMRQG
jgi:hypothetical protein